MKTTRGSFDTEEQNETATDALDALLACAPRYAPPAGFAERVLAALHEEDESPLSAPLTRPWYLRPYSWGSAAAAACLAATLCLLPLLGDSHSIPADSLAVDDTLLVEEVLDCIDDPDLVSAICSVSTGAYSLYTGNAPY